jgi:signal transduction histidine kinase
MPNEERTFNISSEIYGVMMEARDLDAVAQELGSPLDALGLLARALRHRELDAEPVAILDQIDLGLMQLRRQIASVLDILRTERCLARSEQRSFPLMPLFDKLALQMSRLAYENQVDVSIMPTSNSVVSDPAALEVMLRNLLVNSLFFARGGRVLLGCRRRGCTVEIQVWDNGIGIPQQHQAIIFEPLQKLNDESHVVQGLGIGLTLVRELARIQGHGLDLRSEPSKGSVFSLTLPRDDESTCLGAERVRQGSQEGSGPSGHRPVGPELERLVAAITSSVRFSAP